MPGPANNAVARTRSLLASSLDLAGCMIFVGNLSVELSDRSTEVKYPAVYIYCDKVANLLTEKFRTFSGQARVVIEVRFSQDKPDGLESGLESVVDAVIQVLDQNRGDWGQGMFFAGAWEVAYGPLKHGGRNFIQIAKITYPVEVSTN